MSSAAILHFDLGSPYAYLASERAAAVLGHEPHWQPVLVGGIFVQRGHGSWGETEQREQGMREIEVRAERYGLPPIAWPGDWPNNTLQAMRAAIWAERLGAGQPFARAAFRRAFRHGADLSQVEELIAAASSAGLDGDALPAAIAEREIKDALREATARAWDRGVVGVPCIEVAGEIFFGDDRLEAAKAWLDRSGAS